MMLGKTEKSQFREQVKGCQDTLEILISDTTQVLEFLAKKQFDEAKNAIETAEERSRALEDSCRDARQSLHDKKNKLIAHKNMPKREWLQKKINLVLSIESEIREQSKQISQLSDQLIAAQESKNQPGESPKPPASEASKPPASEPSKPPVPISSRHHSSKSSKSKRHSGGIPRTHTAESSKSPAESSSRHHSGKSSKSKRHSGGTPRTHTAESSKSSAESSSKRHYRKSSKRHSDGAPKPHAVADAPSQPDHSVSSVTHSQQQPSASSRPASSIVNTVSHFQPNTLNPTSTQVDEQAVAQRFVLWTSAPFANIHTFLTTYMTAKKRVDDAASTVLVPSLSSSSAPSMGSASTSSDQSITAIFGKDQLQDLIIRYMLPLMLSGGREALEQGLAFIDCQDPVIIREMFGQLIANMNRVKGFESTHATIAFHLLIQKVKPMLLEPKNEAALTQFLDEQMNSMVALDIGLSCQLVQSMVFTLQRILIQENVQILTHHREHLRQTVDTLEDRLQKLISKTKARAEQPDATESIKYEVSMVNNLKTAIIEMKAALLHLPDERTTKERYVGRLLQVASLLVQAGEVGAQCFGAAATFGAASAGILPATIRLISNIIDMSQRVYYHYADNEAYFNALVEWQHSFYNSSDTSQIGHIDEFRGSLATYTDATYRQHPGFISGVLQILMSNYTIREDLRAPILMLLMKLLSDYTKQSANKHEKLLNQQICYYLLVVAELDKKPEAQGGIMYPNDELRLANENCIAIMDDDDTRLYRDERAESAAKLISYNLAAETWHQCYPGDIWLHKWIGSHLGKDNSLVVPEDIEILRNIAIGHPGAEYKVSDWGKAVIKTFGRLPELYPHIIKKIPFLTYKNTLTGPGMTLSTKTIKAMAQDKELKAEIREWYGIILASNPGAIKAHVTDPEIQKANALNMETFFMTMYSKVLATSVGFTKEDAVIIAPMIIKHEEADPTNDAAPSSSRLYTS